VRGFDDREAMMSADRPLAVLVCAAALLLAGGCARYEFDLIDPPDLAHTIGRDAVTFRTEAAEYQARAVDGRLVMNVFNRSEAPLTISPTRSVVVTSEGQSRPIFGQTIAPGSFGQVMVPPPRPTARADGPALGYGPQIGLGYGYGWGSSRGYYRGGWGDRGDRYRGGWRGAGYHPYPGYVDSWDGPLFYNPPRFTIYDTANPAYWDWTGQTQVVLELVFERDGRTLTDRFVIQRRKAS
jgi:hypothetical protein